MAWRKPHPVRTPLIGLICLILLQIPYGNWSSKYSKELNLWISRDTPVKLDLNCPLRVAGRSLGLHHLPPETCLEVVGMTTKTFYELSISSTAELKPFPFQAPKMYTWWEIPLFTESIFRLNPVTVVANSFWNFAHNVEAYFAFPLISQIFLLSRNFHVCFETPEVKSSESSRMETHPGEKVLFS